MSAPWMQGTEPLPLCPRLVQCLWPQPGAGSPAGAVLRVRRAGSAARSPAPFRDGPSVRGGSRQAGLEAGRWLGFAASA